MKPLHVLAAAAILVVAALVAFLAMHDDGRAGGYRSGTQASGTGSRAPRADAPSADTAAADAAGAATGSQEPGAASDDAGPISITLRIVGPDDAPASGADVTLDRSVDALRAKADEMGVLLVHDLKPGVYDLRARHGQLGGALRFETKGALDLGTLRLTAAVTITGHVYGPESEPVPNALVEARRAIVREGAAPRVPLPEGATADATTDAKGAYALVVPTGEAYALRATARGLAPANREPAIFATDASGIDLYLREGAVLAGRVVADGDRPVPGARILVADPRGADDRPATGEAATGPDGAFSLLAEPGAHMLVVIAAGCARERGIFTAPRTDIVVTLRAGASLRLLAVEAGRARAPAARVRATVTHIGGSSDGETDGNGRLLIENLPIDSRAVTGQRLRLSGAGFLPLVIDLARAQPVDGVVDLGVVELARGGVVTGRVLDRTTGEPVGGARVGAFGGRPGQITAERMASGVSAQDGSFRLEGVPLDAHTRTATHAHFVDESVPTLTGGGSGGPMLFRQGSREAVRDVELVPAERIAGAVLGPDDAPVTEAEVSVVADERGRIARLLGGDAATARSDGKGAFVLEGFHLGQRTKLVARHADYGPSEEVDAVVGEPATLRLAEPTTLAGLVTDPSGIAIEDVRVEAAGRTGTTDGAGRFLVRNVAIGRLRVKFEHPDYLPAEYEVKFTGSMDLGRTALVPGGSIVGVVVRDDQTPAPGVTVHATREPAGGTPGRTSGSAVTDAKGTFEIRGLGEGDYRLRVRTGKAWSADAAARTGARDVRIVLVHAGKLL
ncbi:MAG TPA: carboxypeptidase-like regulatory domain-containing protein, partial [Planctomycetota bacterium]|nr:carboxypeptidase-like regulatory domain-containing protein [Planctomycetota bacterium]